MTPAAILENIMGIRANLHTLILLAATLTQRITAARETVKQTEDGTIAEIWADEQWKNDRQRTEQKRLARINDERYLEAEQVVRQLEIDRATCNANILVTQNELTIATTQYQQAMISDYVGGLRFQMQMVQVHSADQTSMEVKPQLAVQDPVPQVSADPFNPEVQAMAKELLAAYVKPGSKVGLSHEQKCVCEIAAKGDTFYLTLDSQEEIRSLHAALPTADAAPVTSPVETKTGKLTEEEILAGEAAGTMFVNRRKDPVHPELTEEQKAPYLKPGDDKKPEKVGNVRI